MHTLPYTWHGREIFLQIWDVSSAEVDAAQSSLHVLLCDQLDGIFFVFNVHRVSSIAAIDKWRHHLGKYVSAKEIPFFLISHKADLLQKRVMASDDIEAYAQAAGYKGWIWTVGRPSFGENERKPAVMHALERMVDQIDTNRTVMGSMKPKKQEKDLLQRYENDRGLDVVHTDDALHEFSMSLLRIPTKAITTLPREEKTQTPEEMSMEKQPPKHSYGGSWLMGNHKGMYLHLTSDSIIAPDESDLESEDKEDTYDFPFAKAKYLDDSRANEARNVIEGDSESELEDSGINADEDDDSEAWKFFAGSISRTKAEEILSTKEEGSFLLRRKDAQTLVLSYVGPSHIHHALIEYNRQRYYVGSSKSAQVSFSTLSRCLRSVRKYAFRGLVFARNVEFRVGTTEDAVLEHDLEVHERANQRVLGSPTAWRTRAHSGSGSSTASQRPSKDHGLQAHQEHVQIPPKTKIDELSTLFFEQLEARLTNLPVDQSTTLLEMAASEKKEWKSNQSMNAELQWRRLVRSMEAWNRIMVNLELPISIATAKS